MLRDNPLVLVDKYKLVAHPYGNSGVGSRHMRVGGPVGRQGGGRVFRRSGHWLGWDRVGNNPGNRNGPVATNHVPPFALVEMRCRREFCPAVRAIGIFQPARATEPKSHLTFRTLALRLAVVFLVHTPYFALI